MWNSKEIPRESGKVQTIRMLNDPNLKILAGPNKWRPVEEFKCTYVVERQLYRKDVTTEEFTGLRNYITGNLEIQMLGVKIPLLGPKDGWAHLEQNLEELISKEALIITVEGPILQADQFSAGQATLVELLGDS